MRTRRLLEAARSMLPSLVEFNSDFHASKNHLLTALEVNTELHNITIVYRKWLGLCSRRTESNVIQKSARRTLDIFDIPLSPRAPEFTVASTDHFRLETNRCG